MRELASAATTRIQRDYILVIFWVKCSVNKHTAVSRFRVLAVGVEQAQAVGAGKLPGQHAPCHGLGALRDRS